MLSFSWRSSINRASCFQFPSRVQKINQKPCSMVFVNWQLIKWVLLATLPWFWNRNVIQSWILMGYQVIFEDEVAAIKCEIYFRQSWRNISMIAISQVFDVNVGLRVHSRSDLGLLIREGGIRMHAWCLSSIYVSWQIIKKYSQNLPNFGVFRVTFMSELRRKFKTRLFLKKRIYTPNLQPIFHRPCHPPISIHCSFYKSNKRPFQWHSWFIVF